MDKINQIKTTTDRELSPLNVDTKFLYHVWGHNINNVIKGLSFTQRKLLNTNLDHIIYWIRFDSIGFSAVTICNYLEDRFKTMYGLANGHYDCTYKIKDIWDENPSIIMPNNNTLRIQKFIRLIAKDILTEHEIRSETKFWTNKCGDVITFGDDNYGFCRYWSKKIFIFRARLYFTLSKKAQKIVHIADPITFLSSRRLANENIMSHETTLHRKWGRTVSNYELIFYNKHVAEQGIIGLDSNMNKYLPYSSYLSETKIVNKFISTSLLSDVTQAISKYRNNIPQKIVKDKPRYKEVLINLYKMYHFAVQFSYMPAKQGIDRHFTINKDGLMSYTPAKKPTYLTSNGNWLSGADRMICKFGKGVRKLFATYPDKIEETLIENICNVLKAKHTFTAEFKIVEGEDIRKWYHENNHSTVNHNGTLDGSCMRYPRLQKVLDIYCDNPKTIKLLTAIDNTDKMIGRALLWYDNKGQPLVADRIYGNDKTITAFTRHCHKLGFTTRNLQSHSAKETFVSPIGELHKGDFSFKLKPPKSKLMPYMDTMRYMYVNKDGSLQMSNLKPAHDGKIFSVDCTNGSLYGYSTNVSTPQRSNDMDGGIISDHDEELVIFPNGDELSLDDCSFCDYYEYYFPTDNTVYCEADDCTYHEDICYWVGDYAYCQEREYDDHVWSEYEDEYVFMDDCSSVVDSNGDHIDYVGHDNSSYSEYNNEDYLSEDSFYCEVAEDYCHDDNAIRVEFIDSADELGQPRFELIADWLEDDEIHDHYASNDEQVRIIRR